MDLLSNMSLCNDFILQAVKTWNLLRISESTGIHISEESITDFHLLDLQYKHPSEVLTTKYSKWKEGTLTGADWEWWLLSANMNSALGLRVQAKKLDSANLRYDDLNHVTRSGRVQIDMLINNALNNHTIPIYVFYNYWDTIQHNPSWNCGSNPKTIEMLGCGCCHASYIKSVINLGKNGLRDIDAYMYPWSCLVCCHGCSDDQTDLPNRIFDFINNKLAPDEELNRQDYVRQSPPYYVKKIRDGEKLSDDEWEQMNLKTITVISEKFKNNINET